MHTIITVGVIPLLCIMAAVMHGAPLLEAEPSRYDFGTAREGAHVPVSFTLVNEGDETVIVKETTQSSGCIAPGPPLQEKIEPGEEVELDYIFATTGYGGVTVRKWIKIFYNNPDARPLKLTVSGRVEPLKKFQAPAGEMMYNFFALIDLRPHAAYTNEHILGAVHIPVHKVDEWSSHVSAEAKEKQVFYLYSQKGQVSDAAAVRLRKKGFSRVYSLVGGMEEFIVQYGKNYIVEACAGE